MASNDQRPSVRTIPPYIRSADWESEDDPTPSTTVPRSLTNARLPMSMHIPYLSRHPSEPGRQWDKTRSAEPPIITTPFLEYGSRWREFVLASGATPDNKLSPEEAANAKRIYEEYDRKKNNEADQETLLAKEKSLSPKRRGMVREAKRTLLRNAFVPLALRIFVLVTSIIALALGIAIFEGFKPLKIHDRDCRRGATTYLAIIVDVFAIPYTMYIALDEFKSKPIGLRSPGAKLRLLLLDLIFIVFEAANVALAFQVLSSTNFVCSDSDECGTDTRVCDKQKGLVAVLMIALVAWLSTFMVSLVRLMYKVGGR